METKRSTFSLYYFIDKSRMDKDKRCPVNLRITVNGTEAPVSIKRKIHIDNWQAKGGHPVGKTEEVRELKNFMTVIETKIFNVHKELLMSEPFFDAHTIKNKAFGLATDKSTTLMQLFQIKIDKEKLLYENKIKSVYTYNLFSYSKLYLQEFLFKTYKLEDISLVKIDRNFIDDFIDHLRVRSIGKGEKEKKMSEVYIKMCLQKFNFIMKTAIKNKIISYNPLDDEDIHLGVGAKEKCSYLVDEELKKIIDADLPEEYLKHERNFFLFCVFTGLSNCDFRDLKRVNLEKENGKWWVRTYRNKTELLSNIPLLEQAEAIIRLYHPKFEDLPYDTNLFPAGTLAARLLHLRGIRKICGISKHLTTHVARHRISPFQLKTSKL